MFFLRIIAVSLISLHSLFAMDTSSAPKRILLISPGVLHGLAFSRMLEGLESEVGKPCAEIFDLVSGSSTGGIIALCLAHGLPACSIKDSYYTLGVKVFNQENIMNQVRAGDCLDSVMKEVFGIKRMSEASIPVIVNAVDKSKALGALKSIQLSSTAATQDKENWDCPVWAAARATSTLPGYFTDGTIEFPNGRKLSNLGDAMGIPFEDTLNLAKALFAGQSFELYVIGYNEAEKIQSYLREKDLLHGIQRIFSLTCEISASEYDSSKESLESQLSEVDVYLKTSAFREIVGACKNR